MFEDDPIVTSITAEVVASAALANNPGLLASKVLKPATGYQGVAPSGTWRFPITEATGNDGFWEHMIRFIQADNIKAKDGGSGILESFIGFDYSTMDINPDYTLPKSKLPYTVGDNE